MRLMVTTVRLQEREGKRSQSTAIIIGEAGIHARAVTPDAGGQVPGKDVGGQGPGIGVGGQGPERGVGGQGPGRGVGGQGLGRGASPGRNIEGQGPERNVRGQGPKRNVGGQGLGKGSPQRCLPKNSHRTTSGYTGVLVGDHLIQSLPPRSETGEQ